MLVLSVVPEAPELWAVTVMRAGWHVTCRVCRHPALGRCKRSPFICRRCPFMLALSSPLCYILYVRNRVPAPSAATPPRKVPVRVPLAGEELRAFRDEENRKRRLEAEEEEQRRHAAAMEKEQASRRSGLCFFLQWPACICLSCVQRALLLKAAWAETSCKAGGVGVVYRTGKN